MLKIENRVPKSGGTSRDGNACRMTCDRLNLHLRRDSFARAPCCTVLGHVLQPQRDPSPLFETDL